METNNRAEPDQPHSWTRQKLGFLKTAPAKAILQVISIWVLLRILTSAAAAFASMFYNSTGLRWELAGPLSGRLYQILIDPWWRWDSQSYMVMVQHGYLPGTIQFHPLYIWISKLPHLVGIDPLLSLLLIGTTSALLLMFAFTRLARLDHPPETVFPSLMFFVLFPSAYIFFAPYPESLFLFLAVSSLYFARRERWWLAGAAGGLAVLTRQQGIFLIVPFLVELYQFARLHSFTISRLWKPLLAAGLIPLGYLFWIGYRTFALNDVHADFSSLQGFIYSVLISPSATSTQASGITIQGFRWPWVVIYQSIQKAITEPGIDVITNLLLATVFLVLLAVTWKGMRWSYRAYSVVIFLVSFSYYTGPIFPVMGLPRHLLLAFPLFLGLGQQINKPWQRLLLIGLSIVGYIFLLWLHGMEAWVP